MTPTFFTSLRIPLLVRTRISTKWVYGKIYIQSTPPVYKNGLYKMTEPKAIFWAKPCPAQNDGLCRARPLPFCAGNFKGDVSTLITICTCHQSKNKTGSKRSNKRCAGNWEWFQFLKLEETSKTPICNASMTPPRQNIDAWIVFLVPLFFLTSQDACSFYPWKFRLKSTEHGFRITSIILNHQRKSGFPTHRAQCQVHLSDR